MISNRLQAVAGVAIPAIIDDQHSPAICSYVAGEMRDNGFGRRAKFNDGAVTWRIGQGVFVVVLVKQRTVNKAKAASRSVQTNEAVMPLAITGNNLVLWQGVKKFIGNAE